MQPPDQAQKLTVSEALRLYRMNLIGVAVFPSVFIIGEEIFHIPFLVFAPLFFLALGLAGWPYLTRRAPHSFWIVACGIYMGGGLLAVFLLQILNIIKAIVA